VPENRVDLWRPILGRVTGIRVENKGGKGAERGRRGKEKKKVLGIAVERN